MRSSNGERKVRVDDTQTGRGKLSGPVIWLAALLLSCSVAADELSPELTDEFERHVRPILVARCIECHGPQKQESGLRVDRREGLIQGGDRGTAVVPGSPENSLLIQAVAYDSDDLAMPPDGKLAKGDIARLRQWIGRGAAWPAESPSDQEGGSLPAPKDHWAFRRIKRPPLPKVQHASWPRNAIDYFVLAKLEEAGLTPSPQADVRTLVRRAFLDLIGLPPTYEAVQAFRASADPQRFERLVDRLLTQCEYGQRWGRHWLDVARYADTKGYVDGGQVRFAFAYTYRDYVVRALNDDLPFDQFVLDQLAADQLDYAPDERWRLAGLGFLTVGRRFNHNYHDILDDQIDVISRGLQGVTVTCARCHDHKYDPIPTADYYSLYGILASSYEPSHAQLPVLDQEPETGEYRQYVAELQKRQQEYETKFQQLHQTIQHELRAFAGDYLVYLVQESPQHREGLQNPLKTDRTILRGPSAYGYGAIRRWRTYLAERGTDDPVFGAWHQMNAVDRDAFSTELARVLEQANLNVLLKEKLLAVQPKSMVALARAYGELLEQVDLRWRKRLEQSPDATCFDDPPWEELRQVLYGPDSPATMTPLESIDCYSLDEHTNMRNLAGKVEELSLENKQVPPRAMILRQREQPYEPVIFLRGQPNRPGPRVPLKIPTIFTASKGPAASGHEGAASDRLQLAQAMVSADDPLTARVIVNRVWDWHFGQPLVDTASDFGVRSAPPSHPELLDYLADWFRETGWSMKKLHRLIMSSRTYQQSSLNRSECVGVDPENRLLWRFNARKLQWEVIRDSLLAVSGRLQPRRGGPPVELAPDDPQSTCRTLYLHIDRQDLSRFARNFDFPAPDFTSPRRPSTTVPQQQLFFLNSPFVIEQAKALASQTAVMVASSDAARYGELHRKVLGRDPSFTDDELTQQIHSLRESINNPTDGLLWTMVAHALLQSNEFVYLE